MDKAVILGTASAFPTKERNHPSIYLSFDGTHILLDCGEGTQRQIRAAGLSPSVDYVFITHWHGDHSLGVGGVIQSLNMLRRTEPLTIEGPLGTSASIDHILKTYRFYSNIKLKTRSLDLKKETLIEKIGSHSVYGINVRHSTKCIGYKVKEDDVLNIKADMLKKHKIKSGPFLKALKEGKNVRYEGKVLKAKEFTYLKKGKSFVYLTDLAYEKTLVKFAKNADVLVVEATFSSNLGERAAQLYHMTIKDALTLAKQAGAKRVYLVHTSQRYEDEAETLQKEISDIKNELKIKAEVLLPNDLTEIQY